MRLFVIMICCILMTAMMCERQAKASEFLVTRKLSFEAGAYQNDSRLAYPTLQLGERLTHMTNIAWDYDLYVNPDFSIFWNNKIEGKSTNSQYRYVSWEFETGISFGKLDIYGMHKSEHQLEMGAVKSTYPLQHAVMLRLNLINNPRRWGGY